MAAVSRPRPTSEVKEGSWPAPPPERIEEERGVGPGKREKRCVNKVGWRGEEMFCCDEVR